MEKLSVIILNYNSAGDVVRQVGAFMDGTGIGRDAFVILDNDSPDGDVLEEYCSAQGLFFHRMAGNPGYAHANNWAVKKALEWGRDFFLILNPDIHIDVSTVSKLYQNMIADPSLAVVGPRLVYHGDAERIFSDGGLLYPERGFLGDHANGQRRIDDVGTAGINYNIDYVNGSCMLFRKEVLKDIGFMEEGLFMYYEESEWCYRLKNSPRWRIGIDTDVAAQQSDGSRGKAYEYYMTRNRIWMTKKHAGNLSSVVWERIGFVLKKTLSFRPDFRERASFSYSILKGIWHGLTGKMGKVAI